jgi:hypothetical protein
MEETMWILFGIAVIIILYPFYLMAIAKKPAPYISPETRKELKREELHKQLRHCERQHNIECRLAADGFGRDRGGDLRHYSNRIDELKKELKVK